MAVPKLYKGLDRISNDYGAAFVATYREAKAAAADPTDIPFSKERLVYHGSELVRHGISKRKLVVKNFPDALYTFRARADLPNEILSDDLSCEQLVGFVVECVTGRLRAIAHT